MPEPLAALGLMAAHPSEQQLPGPPSASASSQQAAADAAGINPATINAQVQDSGGEVSMSIQETNRYIKSYMHSSMPLAVPIKMFVCITYDRHHAG